MNIPKPQTRRWLLASVVGIGTAGFVGGAATGAYLSDEEEFHRQRLRMGSLNLELRWHTGSGTDSSIRSGQSTGFDEGATLALQTSGLEPGDSGDASIAYRVCGSSAAVWLRMQVHDETADGELANALEARLWHDQDCDTAVAGGSDVFAEGSVDELVDAPLGKGILLNPCIPDCDPACIGVRWTLPSKPVPSIAGESLELEFEFAAVQCNRDTATKNPWL